MGGCVNKQRRSKRYREGEIFKKKIQDLVGSAYYDISFGLDKDNSITVNINGNTHQNLTDLEIQKTNVDLQGQVKFGDFKNSQLAKSLLNSNQIRGLELQYNYLIMSVSNKKECLINLRKLFLEKKKTFDNVFKTLIAPRQDFSKFRLDFFERKINWQKILNLSLQFPKAYMGDKDVTQIISILKNCQNLKTLSLQLIQKNFGAQVAEELIKALLQLPNLNSIKLCRLLTYYFLSVVISQNAVPQSQNLQKIELFFKQIYAITKKIDESGEAHYQINFIKTLNFLFQNFNRLTELSLQIKYPSYKKLESSTLENCENLKVLKLRFYEQGYKYFSANVSSFCQKILKNCKNLVSLKIVFDIEYCNISRGQLIQFITELPIKPKIQNLSLNFWDFYLYQDDHIDLDLLTDYLQNCSFLHTLKLKFRHNFFDTESSKKIFLNKLLKLKKLVTVKIQYY
ncbi:hypothetical protein ABPG74_019177 [Tetrahymena malaccensis]